MDLKAIKNETPQEGLEKYVEEFLGDRLGELDTLYSSLASNDFSTISEHAHKWKGFSSPYGFHLLESFAKELESFSKEEDANNCRSKLDEIKNYLDIKKEIIS